MEPEQHQPILSVRDLSKSIGGKTIIDRLSLEVRDGEVFGFLGPNGAGKTTTIRMLVGLIRPTSGTVSIAGWNIRSHFRKAMRNVGSIVENPELYSFLTGWENLKQFSRMLGHIPETRIRETVQLVRLESRIHDKIKSYSLGMRQRLGIAQALLNRPRLLILDEPTNGLDPAGIREMRQFVRHLAEEEGISVFVSSHLLSEIQMLCDRVAVIHEGTMIRTASIRELVTETGDKYEWKVEPIEPAVMFLQHHPHVRDVWQEDEQTVVCRIPETHIGAINAALIEKGVTVFGLRPLVLTLEDLFIEWTGETNRA